ncbi:hypothetical protein ACFL6Y_10060, partial [Elusimicrobiota bacterium]
RVNRLRTRRWVLERVAMARSPMVAASLIERRFAKGRAPSYYLSIPTPENSWHSYVRKKDIARYRKQTEAWRQFVHAMAEWVRVNKAIERELRAMGRGRCEKLEIRRGKR